MAAGWRPHALGDLRDVLDLGVPGVSTISTVLTFRQHFRLPTLQDGAA